jgi:threonyl-tRNA synthetase
LAHLTAQAVRALYPGAQNAIGPSVENGWYQDFDLGENKISDADLPKIEKKMKELLKDWKAFDRKEVSKEEALEEFSWNPYKSELINDYGSSEIYSRIEEAKARYAEYSKDPSAFSQTMLPPSENPEDYHQTGYSAEKPRYRKYYQETYKNLYLLPPAGTALFTSMSLMLKSKKKSEKEKALAFFKVIAQKVRKYNIHLSSPQNFKNPKKTFVRIVESEHKDYLPDEES